MKKMITVLMAGFILTGFNAPFNAPVLSEVTELNGYKLRHNEIDYHDFNLWVVTSEDVFERDFEPLYDSVLRPAFDTQMVVAAKVETVQNSYRVKFKKTVADNGALNVYFNVKREKAEETAGTVKPVSMVVVPKDKSIRKVNFYHDNILVKSIPIVTVY